jgi:cytochrome c biogenesis protein CcmG/thiol:disulfide interchange protein DsbE
MQFSTILRNVFLSATLASAVLAVYLVSPTRRPVGAKAVTGRKAAPDFTLEHATGQPVRLADYKGKVVLLNFWATWCGPCKVEIPWFMEFEKSYRDRGFAVLGVSMDDDGWQAVKPYLAAQRVNYRIALGNDRVSELYGGIDSLPTTVLIDREGRVASVHLGLVSRSECATEIQQLLR